MLSIGVTVVCVEQYEIENFDENSKVYVPSDSLTVSTYELQVLLHRHTIQELEAVLCFESK